MTACLRRVVAVAAGVGRCHDVGKVVHGASREGRAVHVTTQLTQLFARVMGVVIVQNVHQTTQPGGEQHPQEEAQGGDGDGPAWLGVVDLELDHGLGHQLDERHVQHDTSTCGKRHGEDAMRRELHPFLVEHNGAAYHRCRTSTNGKGEGEAFVAVFGIGSHHPSSQPL